MPCVGSWPKSSKYGVVGATRVDCRQNDVAVSGANRASPVVNGRLRATVFALTAGPSDTMSSYSPLGHRGSREETR
jgi:hypothetical protein